MQKKIVWLPLFALMTLCLMQCPAFADESSAADVAFFEEKIRPVLVAKCYQCHAADSKILRGGLQLDSREAIRKGGDTGPSVIPGKPEESLLLQAMRHESLEMPPEEKLPEQVIADFELWIKNGAVDPRDEVRQGKLRPVDWEAARGHWAFQPVADPPVPVPKNSEWIQSPIDAFVLERLQQHGFQPAPQADRRTLIRRATFDLTGLAPTVEEVEAFLADESPDSFARVIDRLLDSPHYGERWGRHWLDLVRYADTNGADENHKLPNAWRYRDWVVRMLNQDLPLDQFIIQQIAGDLLTPPEDEQKAGDLVTATGMLVIGPKMLAEQDKDKMMIDIVDEQIDTVSRTMLGLTVGCARCHDHKFDPVSAKDYYSLAGIFYSTKTMADRAFVSKWMERPLPSKEMAARREEHQKKIDAAKAEVAGLKEESQAELLKQKKAELEKLEKEMPEFDSVMAATEADPQDLPVHVRGNHLAPGPEKIPRGMPVILTSVATAPAIPPTVSGRMELANWLVSPQNPLTTRVMANRLWMWHFGKPLMRSPSNWGLQADRPSHPELLDWLAKELVRRNWSLKDMHRTIMLSSAWQMSSRTLIEYEQTDPENRLLWRQNRRRLEAELIRDAVLTVGNSLDLTMGNISENTDGNRRAIYLPINRSALYEMFSTFDYVETANHIEQRPVTTVPHQALFLLNSSMVHEQARKLAELLLKHASAESTESSSAEADVTNAPENAETENWGNRQTESRISLAFERLYARTPTSDELQRSVDFLREAEQTLLSVENPQERLVQTWAALCRTLIAGNEFVYVD